MKEEKIRVLALLPTEYAKTVTIDNTLEAMQQFVGGLIECLPMDDPDANIVLVCNDEGNLCSLSDAMLEKYTNLFKEPIFLAW